VNPRVTLRLECLPGNAPAAVRLRRLLKALERGYGFRALAVPKVNPRALDEVPLMQTSPSANKFRQGFAAGDVIQAGAGEPVRVLQVLTPTKLRGEAGGREVVIEHPWDYARCGSPAAKAA
jgi:hypothetical protein